MLSIFPSLLSLEGFGPLLLRLTLGGIFGFWAYQNLKKADSQARGLSTLEVLVSLSLILGILTQLSALAAAIILAVRLSQKIRTKTFFTDGVNYYFILFVIALTLLVSGAGFFAFDLPL